MIKRALPPILAAAASLVVLAANGLTSARVTSASASAPVPTLEDAARELRAGRSWHAAEILSEMSEDELGREGLMLLARARAGFNDWAGVAEIVGQPWADTVAPVEAPWLRGRALDELGDPAGARLEYQVVLADPGYLDGGVPLVPAPWVAAARHLAATVRAADGVEAEFLQAPVQEALEDPSFRSGPDELVAAAAWEAARHAAGAGDTAAVRLLGSAVESAVGSVVSNSLFSGDLPELRAEALLAAGDSAAAEAAFLALAGGTVTSQSAQWLSTTADLAVARGDTAAGRELYARVLDAGVGGRGAAAAARAAVELGMLDGDNALTIARILDRGGDGARALRAYDYHVESARALGQEPNVRARVERARLSSGIRSRVEEAVLEFRALDEHPDPAIGARVLDIWAGLRRQQGQMENYRTLRRWLVERYPDTDQAAQVVFLRGDAAEDRRDWSAAVRHFTQVTEMAPTRALAGRARMRIGQIHAQTGQLDDAVATFQGYLDRFPRGRRWTEASFWAGRILLQQGDTAGAELYFQRVFSDDAYSYYAAEAAALLGVEYGPDTSVAGTVASAPWVASALERLELLDEAGMDESAGRLVNSWITRANEQGPSAQYPLAEGLIGSGRTIEGINIGWSLVRSDEPWNRRLLQILYPFPRREMVELEAREWGVDPILMAALIRQESAWDRDIVSAAGAVGLMQVMPATGRQLARAIGPTGFTQASLESAEVNLHLGGRFLRDMLERFGPELPLVLSAYNAGPTRATRWRSFPEVDDRLRFTERIPFTETRGYVKNVTRNMALYRALYGDRAERAD